MAKISKSIWGSTWKVQEQIGNTLLYSNFDTFDEAVAYCEERHLEIEIW